MSKPEVEEVMERRSGGKKPPDNARFPVTRSVTPSVASPATVPIPIRYQISNMSWPFPDLRKPQRFWKATSTITCFLVGWWGKTVLTRMNNTVILNKERLVNTIFHRPAGVPLITVSNHESCIDDPALIGVLMTNRQLLNNDKMRWSLAAQDVCFLNKWHSVFFSLGKCAPAVRGLGVYQKAIDFSIERLNRGDWLHVFPEGRVNMERRGLYRLKWGIGRIISECRTNPIVIPFWHTGMEKVLPNDQMYIPRFGNNVLINVGQPIDVSQVLESVRDMQAIKRRKVITDFIQDKLCLLREETLEIREKLRKDKTLP